MAQRADPGRLDDRRDERLGLMGRLERDQLVRPEAHHRAARAVTRELRRRRGSPTTSIASPVSAQRSAIRRFVLARMSSLITPLGRCVASTRWTPRLRPRCAMPISACRGGRRARPPSPRTRRPRPRVAASRRGRRSTRSSVRSCAPWSRQDLLAAGQLGAEAAQHPLGHPPVEVGHDARRRAAAVHRRRTQHHPCSRRGRS